MKKFKSKSEDISYTLSKKLDPSPYLPPIIDPELLDFLRENFFMKLRLWYTIEDQLL